MEAISRGSCLLWFPILLLLLFDFPNVLPVLLSQRASSTVWLPPSVPENLLPPTITVSASISPARLWDRRTWSAVPQWSRLKANGRQFTPPQPVLRLKSAPCSGSWLRAHPASWVGRAVDFPRSFLQPRVTPASTWMFTSLVSCIVCVYMLYRTSIQCWVFFFSYWLCNWESTILWPFLIKWPKQQGEINVNPSVLVFLKSVRKFWLQTAEPHWAHFSLLHVP